MIYSTQHNKNTNEDPKTSVVFENLMLLPDNVFWNILKTAASNDGILPDDAGLLADDFLFWPKWNPNSKYDTGNSNFVEPDIFYRFENLDVIVEAKYSDYSGQYRDEWEREFKAYLNEYSEDKKKVVLFAVGGNRTFEREPELRVDKYRCPVVKFSWASLLNAVLAYEEEKLSNITDERLSSIKRIVRNFQASISRETELYTLSYYKEDTNSMHYGYQFEVTPKDGRRNSIWLSIALWFNEQEVIAIEARNNDSWAGRLCKKIEEGKRFSSKYAEKPYLEDNNNYYFDAKDKFYQEFNDAETFDAQVNVVSKLIDDVCKYYLK